MRSSPRCALGGAPSCVPWVGAVRPTHVGDHPRRRGRRSRRRPATARKRIAFLRLPAATALQTYETDLFVVDADGTGLRRLTPRGMSVFTYQWSPDGKLIAYVDQRLSLWLVRPTGRDAGCSSPTSKQSSVGFELVAGMERTLRLSRRVPTRIPHRPLRGVDALRRPDPRRRSRVTSGWSARRLRRGLVTAGRRDCLRQRRDLGDSPRRNQPSPDLGDGRRSAVVVGWSGAHLRRRDPLAKGHDRPLPSVRCRQRRRNAFSHRHDPCVQRIRSGVVADRAANPLRQTGPPGHLCDRRRWAKQPESRLATRPRRLPGARSPGHLGNSIVYTTGDIGNTDLYVIGIDGRGKVRLTSTPDSDIAPSWAGPY